METLTHFREALERADARLEDDTFRPDRSVDWLIRRTDVDALVTLVRDALVGAYREAAELPEVAQVRETLAFRTASTVGEVAALAHLAAGPKRARELLDLACEISEDDDQRAELEGAKLEPDAFVALQDGRWLHRHERYREARAVLQAALVDARALKDSIVEALAMPRRIKSAPPMFSYNGFGTRLVGHRDEAPDGSHVATLCLTALWIPVLPLRAYRVWCDAPNTFRFQGWVPLSAFARAVQAVVALGVVSLVAGLAVTKYLDSPAHLASQLIDEGAALEASGDRGGALEKYWAAIDEYAAEADVSEAAVGVVRLGLATLPSPCTIEAVEPAHLAANALHQLPYDLREDDPTDTLLDALERCAADIDGTKIDDARAKLAVLEIALAAGERESLASSRKAVIATMAEQLEDQRPVEALRYWVDLLPDERARTRARAIVVDFGDAHALWVESEALIGRLAGDAAIDAGLARAKEQAARSVALAEEGDEAKLRAALAEHPSDHVVAIAVANIERGAGKIDEAIRIVRATGAVGRMPATVQLELASMHREQRDLAEADVILSALVAELTPGYQRALRAFTQAVDAVRSGAIRQLDEGKVPPDLEMRVQGVAESEQPRVFQEWLDEKIASDPEITRRRDALGEHELLVPASIALGTVKLERGQASQGTERDALLGEAERVFLAISTAAAGHPSYHLGLGQLYHRMGRGVEGDAEIDRVLAMDVPLLSFQAAHIYRELGLIERARTILIGVYESDAEEPIRQQAARSLSLVAADLDDKERWLKASDGTQPGVRASFEEVRGQKALRDGDWEAADAAFAAAAAIWEKEAANDGAAANNVAIAYQARYQASGDRRHLEKAVEHLEHANKLQPESIVGTENLADALEELGTVLVLAPWIEPAAALDGESAAFVISAMLTGSEREALVKALRAEPHLRRAQELRTQLMVLAPHRYGAYGNTVRRMQWLRDEEGLTRLLKRLESGPPLKVAHLDQRRAFERGEHDDEMRRHYTSTERRARQRLEKLAGSKPSTRAAGHIRLSESLESRALIFDDAAALDQAIDEMRSAVKLWPEAGFQGTLAHTLVLRAAMRARAQSPALAAAWQESSRILSVICLVDEAVNGPARDEVLAALRAQPEIAEALPMIDPSLALRPASWHHALARWSGDEEALAKTRPNRADAMIRLPVAIDVRIFVGEAHEAAELALFQRNQAD